MHIWNIANIFFCQVCIMKRSSLISSTALAVLMAVRVVIALAVVWSPFASARFHCSLISFANAWSFPSLLLSGVPSFLRPKQALNPKEVSMILLIGRWMKTSFISCSTLLLALIFLSLALFIFSFFEFGPQFGPFRV